MLNQVTLIGRVGSDPKTRTAGDAQVTSFSLATSEAWKDRSGQWQEKTEWHNIVAWRGLAEVCGKIVSKGALVAVVGKMRTRSWDKDGETRYTTEIHIDQLKKLQKSKAEVEGTGEDRMGDSAISDDDIPF